MKLISLTLSQFKGVDSFTLQLDGNNATVHGQNGSGKSSLADAYLWLLTGKNNAGETFDPFPVDETGKRKHQGQEPTVEAVFCSQHGIRFTLKRSLTEKWVRKTGHTDTNYTGDETNCWIDGVPNKIGEYNAYIGREFANESILRLLTNTGYFNQQIKKDERRALLFKTFGNMTDTEILGAAPELAELAGELGRKSVDEYARMIKERYTDTCKQLDLLPVRIDEAAKSLVDGIDTKATVTAISKINVELATLRYDLANDKGDPTADIKQELNDVHKAINRDNFDWDVYLETMKNRYDHAHSEQVRNIESEVSKHKLDLQDLTSNILRGEKRVAEIDSDIHLKRELWGTQKQAWDEKNAETFVVNDENCPTCGQTFPAEKIEEMQANWNERKSETLTQMSAHLSQIQQSGKALAADKDKCNAALASLKEKQEKAQAAYSEAENRRHICLVEHPPYEPDPAACQEHETKIATLQGQIATLETQLAAGNGENPEKTKKQQRVAELETQLAEQQGIIATAKQSDEAQKRIDEYGRQQKELGTVRDHAEKMLHLCDEFIRFKAEKITGNINQHFQIVNFSLFDVLKNGGIKQICEAGVDGVGYDQLNKARQTAASLDIINTFSNALGVSFPLFVDNSESFHTIYGVETGGIQIVKLAVSEHDEVLRVAV